MGLGLTTNGTQRKTANESGVRPVDAGHTPTVDAPEMEGNRTSDTARICFRRVNRRFFGDARGDAVERDDDDDRE